MAVKLGGFAPTLQMPNQVALPVAQPAIRRNLRMDQPEFYQQMMGPQQQQQQQQQPGVESSQRFLDALQPSQANQPTTEDFVRNQISRVGAQDWSPALQPSDRVRSPTANLVQPSEFQNFYEQFDIISRMGHNKTAFVQQQAQAKQMQALQSSMLSGGQGGGGGSYGSGKGLYGDTGRSAKLGMLGSVQPYVRRVAEQISGKFGIGNIGGHATSGHIPGSDHYTGKALDVMVGGRKGQSVLWWALNNANPLRVKYLIFNRKYYEPGKQPVAYTGSNPHTGHVHISFY